MSHSLAHMRSTALMALIAGFALLLIAGASNAAAVQTNIYDEFAACPTDHPRLNGPPAQYAACVSATMGEGSMDLGDLTLPVSSMHLQFAVTSPPDNELEDCTPLTCLPAVPGTTTLESAPARISLVDQHANEGQGKAQGINADVTATVEAAGDARRLPIDFIFGAPVPPFVVPVKVHLESRFLGDDCYIGSNAHPIVLAPLATDPPDNFAFQADPNGFPVEFIKLIGFGLRDASYAVPGATGCGSGKGGGDGINKLVNRSLGLPVPANANEATFADSNLAFVAAPIDGTPPDGGAAIQAAFEAAE
ncbi:MAG: hypothetical protein ACTHLH_05835 [Solirubrobacterales bacterium]